MDKRNKYIVTGAILAIVAVVVFCCGLMGLMVLLPSDDNTTVAATATSALPSKTPTPTFTPTSTPIPTPTSTPMAFNEVEKNYWDMTDLQWEPYSKEIIGKRVRFAGKVIEVYEDGKVTIDQGEGLFTTCWLYGIPYDTAMTLTKESYIQGEGVIREVSKFLGLSVRINVDLLYQ